MVASSGTDKVTNMFKDNVYKVLGHINNYDTRGEEINACMGTNTLNIITM